MNKKIVIIVIILLLIGSVMAIFAYNQYNNEKLEEEARIQAIKDHGNSQVRVSGKLFNFPYGFDIEDRFEYKINLTYVELSDDNDSIIKIVSSSAPLDDDQKIDNFKIGRLNISLYQKLVSTIELDDFNNASNKDMFENVSILNEYYFKLNEEWFSISMDENIPNQKLVLEKILGNFI